MPINDPTEIPGDKLWYRSDLGRTVTSGRVTDWAEQDGTGTGRDLGTGGNTATHPTDVTVDGFPSVQISAGQVISNSGFADNFSPVTAQTMVFVYADIGAGGNTTDLVTARVPFSLQQTAPENSQGYSYLPLNQQGALSSVAGLSRSLTTIGWYLYESGNGVATTGENSDGDTVTAGNATGALRDTFGFLQLNGTEKQWFELIYFPRSLTAGERADLVDYLNDRYFPAAGGPDGTGTLAIQPPALVGTGQVTATVDGVGSLALQLPALTGIGTVQNEVAGSGQIVVPPIQMAGSGVVDPGTDGSGSLAIQALDIQGSASVDPGAIGAGSLAIQSLEVSGSATAGIAINGSGLLAVQSIDLSGDAVVDPGVSGSGSLAIQSAALSGSGIIGAAVIGSGSLSVASVAVSGAGLVDAGVDGSGSLAVQNLQLSGSAQVDAGAVGAGSLAITSVQISGSGTGLPVTNGSGSLSLPSPELSGSASVDPGASGSGALPLQPAGLSGDGIVDPGSVGAGSLSIASLGLSGTGLSDLGPEGIGSLDLPPLTLSGSGTVENGEQGAGTLAIQPLGLSGSGQVTAEITGQALTLQISSLEITGSGVIFRGTLVDPVDLIIALKRNEEILGRGLEADSLIIGSLEDSDLTRGPRGSEPHEIERYVGETKDFILQMPSAVDGSSFVLVVNPDPKASDNSGNVVEIAGIIDPEDSTKVRFTPTAQDAAIPPRVYAVAIWQTTPESRLHLAADTSMELRRAPNV